MWTTPKTWTVNEVVSAQDLNTYLRDNLSALLPIATIIMRAAPYDESNVVEVEARWLQCNGVAVSRTTYSALFTYLNSLSPALPFGSGDGVTTFNLPDMRGRIPVAEGTHSEVDAMGDSDGAALANRSPSHHHVINSKNETGFSQYLTRQANTTDATELKTSGNANLADKPAYLVVGSFFIKFTN